MRRTAVLALALVVTAVPLVVSSLAPAGATQTAPTTEANKALVRRVFAEAFNQGNVAILDTLVAPGYVDHEAGPGAPPGPAAYKQFVTALRATFPDVRVTVEDLIAEGDEVTARVTWHGTQTGALGSIPPTGKSVTFTGIHIYRIRSGQLVEHWGLQDDLGLLEQLGVLAVPGAGPPPAAATAGT